MIYTQETLIIFIAVVLAAALAVSVLSSAVQGNLASARSVSEQVGEQVAADVDIVSVNAGPSEMNVYVKGIAGSVDPEPTVFVDGTVADVNAVVFIRDEGDVNVINAGDLLAIVVSGSYADGKEHEIRVIFPQAEAIIRTVVG